MQEQAARNNMFCSNKCSADSRGREPEIRPCAWCGKRVTRAQALHGCIYCLRKCADLGRRKKLETSSQCLVCKKDFTRIEMLKGRKYCSRKCYGKASIVYREPRQCEHCDKQLDRETLRRKTARWCSVRCRVESKMKRCNPKQCKHCGKDLSYNQSRQDVKCCSRSCANKFKTKRFTMSSCPCGKELTREQRRDRYKYCSMDCYQAAPKQRKGWKPFIDKQGYRKVYAPDNPNARKDGLILEHRKVMSEWLRDERGSNEIPLIPKHYIVHHKNGLRTDNRRENLEFKLRKAHHGEQKCPWCKMSFLMQ